MFGLNTVDGVLGVLAKLESRLANLATKHRDSAAAKHKAASALIDSANGHHDEAQRAERVAQKVRDLVS